MGDRQQSRLWDLPTRIFHWVLVLCIAGSWWTGEREDRDLHSWFGYTILALLLFRLAWGLIGSDTSRFAAFLKPPGAVLAHLRAMFARKPHAPYAGHNPLGGYSVVLMLLSLFVQAVSGLFLYDDEYFWGPLNEHVSESTAELLHEVHEWNFNFLLGLIALHLAAILYYALVEKTNLVRPMITGSFTPPAGLSPPRIASTALAIAVALASALAVYALVRFA